MLNNKKYVILIFEYKGINMKTDGIIKLEPYSMRSNEKNQIFLECMQKSVQFHYKNCNQYRDFCIKRKFDPFEKCSIESIPFLPVSIFAIFSIFSIEYNDNNFLALDGEIFPFCND